ncbi:hypothetical protein EON65_02480 [archaeon]|nr:MAG: hypothetical protein EON65_02480 [archaeon]
MPCVGDELYLQQQMRLFEEEGKTCTLPEVITACPKRAFANPYQFHFKIWQHLCASTKIDFDLLYAPRVFEILLHSCGVREHSSEDQMSTGLRNLFSNHNILYYHCGGVEANESQLARYQYASNRGS